MPSLLYYFDYSYPPYPQFSQEGFKSGEQDDSKGFDNKTG